MPNNNEPSIKNTLKTIDQIERNLSRIDRNTWAITIILLLFLVVVTGSIIWNIYVMTELIR